MRTPNPIAFTLFGIEVRWYGILIALGMMCALYITYRRAHRHAIEPDDVLDLFLWMLPIGIIGARLYYVIFNWSYYAGDIRLMLNTRAGGLAIHGGLIFGALAGYFVCRHKHLNFLEVADLVFPSVALAQCIGRWGNYFNGEAHGGITNVPWAIVVNGQHVHPTFLYESIWCLIMFIVLLRVDDHRHFLGQTACLYGIMYSAERFCVEALRTDSLMIGPLKQAQVISVIIFIISLAAYFYLKKRTDQAAASDNTIKN